MNFNITKTAFFIGQNSLPSVIFEQMQESEIRPYGSLSVFFIYFHLPYKVKSADYLARQRLDCIYTRRFSIVLIIKDTGRQQRKF